MKAAVLTLLALGLPIFGADIYFASPAAGSANGTSCGNAYAYNDGTNGWNIAGKWVAGNTLHICNTITVTTNTVAMTAAASGSAGNVITVKFETGAILQSAAFNTNGAINCNGQSYLTIDGGTNGIIQNTANGDALANQIVTAGVNSGGGLCNNMTVQNLTVQNLYIKTQNSNNATDDSACINYFGNNSRITQNTVSYCATGISSNNSSHHEIDHNTFSFCQHCIADGVSSTNADDINIHDNDIGGGAYLWDNSNNNYHHNAIIIICETPGMGSACLTNLKIYNNWVHGVWSKDVNEHTTGIFFLDDYATGVGNHIQSPLVFNNFVDIAATDTGVANGYLAGGYGGAQDYNNTVRAQGGNSCVIGPKVTGETVKNNVFQSCGTGIYMNGGTLTSGQVPIDYNLYYLAPNWNFGGGADTFVQWQTLAGECLCDLHSVNAVNPSLNSDGTPPVGSAVRGAGTNLTSLGITELLTTAPQTFGVGGSCGTGCLARPAVAAWDIGAYQYSAGATAPTVTTTTASSITTTTASSGGTVTSNGGASVTSEGTCYATTSNPTSPCTSDGTSTPFTSSITGLSPGTLYHYRAFATNSAGTGYGSDLTFTTIQSSSAAGARGGAFVSSGNGAVK